MNIKLETRYYLNQTWQYEDKSEDKFIRIRKGEPFNIQKNFTGEYVITADLDADFCANVYYIDQKIYDIMCNTLECIPDRDHYQSLLDEAKKEVEYYENKIKELE